MRKLQPLHFASSELVHTGSELSRAGGRSRIRRSRGHSTPEGRFTPLTPGLNALDYELGL
eukprot:6212686-Pleurochrysis_carterae.AAC.3